MKTVFLDRDGVINKNPPDYGYVRNWREFVFLPNALAAIRDLTHNGYRIIVVTNQAGIGKGIYTEQHLADIHCRMLAEIEEAEGQICKVYYCPHHPEAGCKCRKPEPGMLIQAAREHDIDVSKTYFIGDSITDMQAARSASALPILVLTGHGRDSYNRYSNSDSTTKISKPEKIFTNLYTASRWLIRC
ncbi:MAG: D-glycero-beta-D-manno-heptose 1,7-bisphosphate 7-phosphatase [Candidatus Poribacteria bacterium]|nr:D-glycero-beta-D-manno-heptose 1,7-bisphosphate 7-phosphatase [Candidatus Poribacteria bacterium]